MRKKENTLTRMEFQIMSALWDINRSACAWDILDRFEDPKPAYTTIATYMKVLREKGYVDYFKNKGEGKTHMYVAKVTRAEYTRQTMKEMKKNLFDDSLESMFSFFVTEEKLTAEDIAELLRIINGESEQKEEEGIETLMRSSIHAA
jgi:predicted transcriptional regulator